MKSLLLKELSFIRLFNVINVNSIITKFALEILKNVNQIKQNSFAVFVFRIKMKIMNYK